MPDWIGIIVLPSLLPIMAILLLYRMLLVSSFDRNKVGSLLSQLRRI